MTALTVSHPETIPPPPPVEPSEQAGTEPLVFQTIAVVATTMTAVTIFLTGAMDMCSSFGPVALLVAWFVLPIVAISSIAGAVATTRNSALRYLTAIVAVGFAGMWLLALVWAQVGNAMNQVTC